MIREAPRGSSRSAARIVIASSSLAAYPEGGGHWSAFLQYIFGLRALGHEVLWIELYRVGPDPKLDETRIRRFLGRFRRLGLGGTCVVLQHEGAKDHVTLENARYVGKTHREVLEFAATADQLWNLCCSVFPPFLNSFRRTLLLDLDPGLLQISGLTWNMGFDAHDVRFTIGANLGRPGCDVPTFGLEWKGYQPIGYMPLWNTGSQPAPDAPYTSITQWNWEVLHFGGREASLSKRAAYLRYLDLPSRTRATLELAANIDLEDTTGDREMMALHGWRVVHPHAVCRTPAMYRRYLQASKGEISCPKPIYRELQTGWFSDRSVAYLASGRPVIAEDTGLRGDLSPGYGLLWFSDVDGAAAALEAIESDYAAHSRAAQEIAEEYFSAERTLRWIVEEAG
jgi:hypothetical protein